MARLKKQADTEDGPRLPTELIDQLAESVKTSADFP